MQCPQPIRVKRTPKLDGTGGFNDNGGFVPCGHCPACKLNTARGWSVRIMHEVKQHPGSCFVTLTYDDEHLPKNGTLVVEDCQKFLKRLRKSLCDKKIRYYLGAEYGDKGRRPHYHAIIFGLTKEHTLQIKSAWPHGFVYIGDVTHNSACYVAQYTNKKRYGTDAGIDYAGRGVIPEFSLMSRRPGIGTNYVKTNLDFIKRNFSVIVKGNRAKLPRFYQNLVFKTEAEKKLYKENAKKHLAEKYTTAMASAQTNDQSDVMWHMKREVEQSIVNLKCREELKKRKL